MKNINSNLTRKADAGPSKSARTTTRKATAPKSAKPPKPPVSPPAATAPLPPIPCTADRLLNNLAQSAPAIVQARYDELMWLCKQVAGDDDDARPWLDAHVPKHGSIKRAVAIDRFKWKRRWVEVIIKTYPGYSPEIHFVFDHTAIGHTATERTAVGERSGFIVFSRRLERDSRRRGNHRCDCSDHS